MARTSRTIDLLENTDWHLYKTPPGNCKTPTDLTEEAYVSTAAVPGTVATALWGLENEAAHPEDTDQFDWWYQCQFKRPSDVLSATLSCDGLATIADVWINDQPILSSRNMFIRQIAELADALHNDNTLTIAFRSVTSDLKKRRPRGRWKTNLVDAQQLRWIRTTLLGRIPGWTPPIKAIGPWRAVRLEAGGWQTASKMVRPFIRDKQACLEIDLRLRGDDLIDKDRTFTLQIDGRTYPLTAKKVGGNICVSGELEIDGAELWWPHTEGSPRCYPYSICIESEDVNNVITTGNAGFRSVRFEENPTSLSILVNDRLVPFCRGFCWSIANIRSLTGDRDSLLRSLTIARDAGANLIRIGGTMVYESDEFYEICDQLGLMVWQDLMFANMDYPIDDAEFSQSVGEEVEQQSKRLCQHPCVVAFCGNSEVEQQAAMFGQTADVWKSPLFYELIPNALRAVAGDLPYFPSSPTGGALPFHNRSGISHYFGVGAYKKPVNDVINAGVLFSTECLGFSNVPAPAARQEHFDAVAPYTHNPKWKSGVPRDAAAGWDFEDIRDHYLRELYGYNAVDLRYSDNARYINTATAVTGDVMETVFSYWQRPDNPCNGALIWFLKDIVPGAGWGCIDSDNNPKPLYYFLRRAWANRIISLIDAGLDGLQASFLNRTAEPWTGKLEIRLLQHSKVLISEQSVEIDIPAHGHVDLSVDKLLGRFFDTTYSYRFGPPKHDVTVASVLDGDGSPVQTAVHFPNGRNLSMLDSPTIDVTCEGSGDEKLVHLTSNAFLQCVELNAKSFEFSENYFHMAPGTEYTVHASRRDDSARSFRAQLSALNLEHSISIR